jgi:hypothetical protein
MARPARGGRVICESCIFIDVRHWHRLGRLQTGQHFPWSWSQSGEPAGSIHVRTELDAVILTYRAQSFGATEWKSIEQRVPITWTSYTAPARLSVTRDTARGCERCAMRRFRCGLRLRALLPFTADRAQAEAVTKPRAVAAGDDRPEAVAIELPDLAGRSA